MATKHGLGADPLDALTEDAPVDPVVRVSPVSQVGLVGSVGKEKPPKARLEPVKLDSKVVDQARAAVWWLMNHGQPTTTLKAMTERALLAEVQRLTSEYNDGRPFPNEGPLPRGGRIQPR